MAVLSDDRGNVLEIELLRYLYELEGIRSDWDANWLSADVRITHNRSVHAGRTDVLNFDIADLAQWLHAWATGAGDAVTTWDLTHPSLRFAVTDRGDAACLTVYFAYELWYFDPALPKQPRHDGTPVTFLPGPTRLAVFAGELSAEVAAFPVRVLEATGPASRYLEAHGHRSDGSSL